MDTTDAVARIARSAAGSEATVAVAESLTCGALAHALGAGEGASAWLAGGVVAYRTEVKVSLLGVPESADPCSAECAEHLASGVRALLGADVAVSATGVGGPEPEGPHASGTVYIGWDDGAAVGHERHVFDGDPEAVIEQTVAACLDRLETVLGAVEGRATG